MALLRKISSTCPGMASLEVARHDDQGFTTVPAFTSASPASIKRYDRSANIKTSAAPPNILSKAPYPFARVGGRGFIAW